MAVLVSAAALAVTGAIALDAIDNSLTPDIEYGIVASKAPLSDGNPADYMVTLTNSKTLYTGNATLYGSIQENVSYLFTCHIDSSQKIIIDSLSQKNRPVT